MNIRSAQHLKQPPVQIPSTVTKLQSHSPAPVSTQNGAKDEKAIFTQKGSAVSSLNLQNDPPFSQSELAWFHKNAQAFETGVTQVSVKVTSQEEKQYTEIVKQLQQKQPVSQKDIDWALKLEKKITKGTEQTFKPTPEEKKQYDTIKNYLQENNLQVSPRAFNGPQVYYSLTSTLK